MWWLQLITLQDQPHRNCQSAINPKMHQEDCWQTEKPRTTSLGWIARLIIKMILITFRMLVCTCCDLIQEGMWLLSLRGQKLKNLSLEDLQASWLRKIPSFIKPFVENIHCFLALIFDLEILFSLPYSHLLDYSCFFRLSYFLTFKEAGDVILTPLTSQHQMQSFMLMPAFCDALQCPSVYIYIYIMHTHWLNISISFPFYTFIIETPVQNSVDTGDLLFTHRKRLTFCQTLFSLPLGEVKTHQDQVLKVVFSRKRRL